MKLRANLLAVVAAASLLAMPAWADRGGHGHGRGWGWGWGPAGFLLGSALLYSAIQPRAYYGPQVVYAPPVYGPPVVQPYYEQTYVVPPVVTVPPATYVAQGPSTEMPGGGQWWYFCRKLGAYYPYVKECPSGWEKVSPTPSGVIRP